MNSLPLRSEADHDKLAGASGSPAAENSLKLWICLTIVSQDLKVVLANPAVFKAVLTLLCDLSQV